jgi:hypothetical protein
LKSGCGFDSFGYYLTSEPSDKYQSSVPERRGTPDFSMVKEISLKTIIILHDERSLI